MRRLLCATGLMCIYTAGICLSGCSDSIDGETYRRIAVSRGTVVRHATAVGRIEVEHEVPIKSLYGGVLTRLFVKLGQKVIPGDPLAEVRPVLTERSLLAAERALESARDGEERAREYFEGKTVAGLATRWIMGANDLTRMQKEAMRIRQQAQEWLELQRNGSVTVDDRKVDFIVRAPVAGHVLDLRQREGSPVVPSSSYGSGTVFMTLADMSKLVFKGTVDEIDVGRLREGMEGHITVGALPEVALTGTLVEIALKGREQNNAVNFPVRIRVNVPEAVFLRSGFSAVARIDVDRREGVLVLPERVVRFQGEKAFVQVPGGGGAPLEREIRTGLSDGLTVEVLDGLTEGQEVLERGYE